MQVMQHYDMFRDYLKESCGIVLGDSKQYLVTSRISRIMQDNQIGDLQQLVNNLRRNIRSPLKEQIIDAMTTNETSWMRDIHPYEILRKRVLPELMDNSFGQARIWCAACSSGQEPFSISMVIEEFKQANMGALKRPIEILGTDLSKTMLNLCEKAEYDSLAIVRGLSEERKNKFFSHNGNGVWKIKNEVKSRVRFKHFNLLDNFALLGKFDLVFCRNVLIYFSSEQKSDILRRIHASLKPGGYLFLGASESLNDTQHLFEMVHCSPGIIYRAK